MNDTILKNKISPRFKFQIWHLFYLVAFYAAGFAWFPGTVVFTTLYLVIAFVAEGQSTRRQAFMVWVWSSLIFLFGFCCLFAPMSRNVRGAAIRSSCANNIRQMMIAMLNYESAHGVFPEASMLDANGKPAHSWRVLLLPFMEENNLYQQYRFDEPWDGPNNRKLAKLMPEPYRCPGHRHGFKTHYKLVCGKGTAFIDGVALNLNKVPDGLSNTAAIVEVPGDPVDWMKPEDITLEEAVKLFSEQKLEDIAHGSQGGFVDSYTGSNIGMLDGSIQYLGVECDADELRRLFGLDNGVPDFDRLDSGTIRHKKYDAIIAFWVYILLIVAPLLRIALKNYDRLPPADQALPEKAHGVQ